MKRATSPRGHFHSHFRNLHLGAISRHHVLPALALTASLALTLTATAQSRTGPFARECALKEISVLILIGDHRAAQDLPADRLGKAGLTMLDARSACYAGRVGEALALYEGILALGPVASLRPRQP
jgi:hypothetical protein